MLTLLPMEVDQYAKSHQDNAEAIADINIAKAAKELWSMIKLKNQPPSNQNNELYESSLKRFIELERSVNKMNEFTWLIKGFVQIIQGEKTSRLPYRMIVNFAMC
jgi:hypothetical protein